MEKIISLVSLVAVIILGIIVLGGSKSAIPLGAGSGPAFSTDSVINSSSSVTANGQILWTNVSSTGDWFRIVNAGAQRVFCALGTATTTQANFGGQLLTPITSSTGSNVWEMYNVKGAVACWADAASLVTFSYTGR